MQLLSLLLAGAAVGAGVGAMRLPAADLALLPAGEAFSRFQELHQRSYKDEGERLARAAVFEANLAFIRAAQAQNGATFTVGVNAFADLSWDEFRATHLGLAPGADGSFQQGARSLGGFRHGNVTAKKEVDWVKEGVVSGVKNQGMCGSCWAFSTTGAVEGVNALYTGKLVSLSEQELVDCDTSLDQGCGGGLMDQAYAFILQNGGLDTEKDYSYTGIGGFCNRLREGRTVVSIDGYEDVPVNSEAALRKAASQQPVSVAICAGQALQFYTGGVFGGPSVQCTGLNHGVLVVGYGELKDGSPYWKVKNSWGAAWGEEGYFRLRANTPEKEGPLGIAMAASYPVKSSPNPDAQPEVCGYWGWTQCAAGSQCTCQLDILGLLCWEWGCKPASA